MNHCWNVFDRLPRHYNSFTCSFGFISIPFKCLQQVKFLVRWWLRSTHVILRDYEFQVSMTASVDHSFFHWSSERKINSDSIKPYSIELHLHMGRNCWCIGRMQMIFGSNLANLTEPWTDLLQLFVLSLDHQFWSWMLDESSEWDS